MDTTQTRNYLWIQPQLRKLVRKTRLVLIGCGGNGVAFAINAVHIGFRHFVLCDPDTLSDTNLNRYIIAVPSQVGTPKVKILSDYMLDRFKHIQVKSIESHFPDATILRVLTTPSIVVSCVDNEITRIQLDLSCRKNGRTLIDLGSGFTIDTTETGSQFVSSAGGQVFLSRPTGACLRCMGFDLSRTSNNNYFIAGSRAEPSSVLINNVMGALAVECILKELLHDLAPLNAIEYDRGSPSLRTRIISGKEGCQICGTDSQAHVASVAEKKGLANALAKEGIRCKTAWS